jgi:hypothetical protein
MLLVRELALNVDQSFVFHHGASKLPYTHPTAVTSILQSP